MGLAVVGLLVQAVVPDQPVRRVQRGEALEALVLTRATGTDAAALLALGRPTVLLLGQPSAIAAIHEEEP